MHLIKLIWGRCRWSTFFCWHMLLKLVRVHKEDVLINQMEHWKSSEFQEAAFPSISKRYQSNYIKCLFCLEKKQCLSIHRPQRGSQSGPEMVFLGCQRAELNLQRFVTRLACRCENATVVWKGNSFLKAFSVSFFPWIKRCTEAQISIRNSFSGINSLEAKIWQQYPGWLTLRKGHSQGGRPEG